MSENQQSFWEILFQVQMYMCVASVIFIIACIVVMSIREGRTISLTESGTRSLRLLSVISDYLTVKLRVKANRIFEFVSIENRPGMVQHVTYRLQNGDSYAIAYKKQRINRIAEVRLEENDVTQVFRRFLGPGNNFYGIPTRPSMIGMGNITVTYTDDTVKTFGAEDVIELQ